MDFLSLYVSKINNINIIQDGDSVISSDNNEANYSDPKGNNKTKKQGAGQENIQISFKSISDANATALKKMLRSDKDVTLTDKFKGNFKATVSSYSITDSDIHIGITKFLVTFKIKEHLKTPKQNIGSSITENSVKLLNNVDMKMSFPIADTVDDAISAVKETAGDFMQASNFADGVSTEDFNILDKIGEYRSNIQDVINNAQSLIHKPLEFKNKIMGIVNSFSSLYSSALSTFNAANIMALYKRELKSFLSIFKKSEVNNRNVIGNSNNIVRSVIMAQALPSIAFDSMDQAKEIQAIITESLNEIYDNDDQTSTVSNYEIVQAIKNDIAIFIQALDLPNVVEIEVFQKPFFVLSYELYGNLDRIEQLKKLNGLIEDDNVTGTIKVFDR